MSWNVGDRAGSDGKVKITLTKDGDTHERAFDSNVRVGDAVKEIAQEFNVKRFDLEDSSGNEVGESESSMKLDEVGNLSMVPAASGIGLD